MKIKTKTYYVKDLPVRKMRTSGLIDTCFSVKKKKKKKKKTRKQKFVNLSSVLFVHESKRE